MNKEILNQIPTEDQPIASRLQAAAEDMQLSPTFQWELETQLMEKHKKNSRPPQGWFGKIATPVGWAILAIGAVVLLSWTIRSLVPNLSAASADKATPT